MIQKNQEYNRSGDRVILEVSEARVINFTYQIRKDKEQVLKLCKHAEKLFGPGSAKRILEYVKKFDLGTIQ
jgi:hypothetical protein